MSGKGLTVHAGLLPVLTFIGKLMFRERIQEAVHKERGANAQYQFTDIVQMVVSGLIAGATSVVQVVKVWSDDIVRKMAGWEDAPVDTTIGRIMKMVSKGDIVELTGVIHRFHVKVWKRAIRMVIMHNVPNGSFRYISSWPNRNFCNYPRLFLLF